MKGVGRAGQGRRGRVGARVEGRQQQYRRLLYVRQGRLKECHLECHVWISTWSEL